MFEYEINENISSYKIYDFPTLPPFRMTIRSFCSRHYKSNKSYCTVEWRNGWYRIFKWFFDRPSQPVITQVLRAIRNEWLKIWDCAWDLFLNYGMQENITWDAYMHCGNARKKFFRFPMTVWPLPVRRDKTKYSYTLFMLFAFLQIMSQCR